MLKRTLCVFCVLGSTVSADISDEANACIDELRDRAGDVGGEVLEQLGSEAGTFVKLRDSNGVVYECIVWTGPEIADFRVADGEDAMADDGQGALANAPPETVSGEQRVQFAAGASGVVLSATLAPDTSVQYVLGAGEEQFLNVDISSYGGAIDYKIFNPDGSLLLDLISSETPYQGQLWQSGDHVVDVLNAGAQPVSFDIGIGIN